MRSRSASAALINLKMADGIRLMTLRRGVDPRGFALLAFGGAAGLHAVDVARELEISRVIVPAMASVLSAWGMLASDLRTEVSRTHVGEGQALDDGRMRDVFADLETRARKRLARWLDGPVGIERSAEMRYGEQIFEIDVQLSDLDWDGPNLVARINERFHTRHEALYTYASRDQEVVFVNARVGAVGPVEQRAAPANVRPRAPAPPKQRKAHFGQWRMVPVHTIEALVPGETLAGPAIFEGEMTTVIAGIGDRVHVTDLGWLDITLAPNAATTKAAYDLQGQVG